MALTFGVGTQVAYDAVCRAAPFMDGDRVLSPEIARLTELVGDGAFIPWDEGAPAPSPVGMLLCSIRHAAHTAL